MNFTPRMRKVITLAAEMSPIVYPHHLLAGIFDEANSVCGEIHLCLHVKFGDQFKQDLFDHVPALQNESVMIIDGINCSKSTESVFKEAEKQMQKYNQQLINEGHLLSCLFQEEAIAAFLGTETVRELMNIACVPRDLIVHLDRLKDFQYARTDIRRAIYKDVPAIKAFILREFGERWLRILSDLDKENTNLPIYIAEHNGTLTGFACYDIVRGRKGLFGPMGTAADSRFKSIGKDMLYTCLLEMKHFGYEFAVIGQAGPIEFYERACGARLIPQF
ncbi:GNAT family N-acetyltransferase [Bacillus mangrovi]|uniref:GNAT family N-acetyltransferase n=1 Tax=Metabacillus mangrovi TaxID=1491830 RepID=A0A7X2S300_9BACI|nr:GNAT family N-acetyltransferase [Metabacillus mangrovi]MTH52315.1 GNAT family N-acetyltransferase [Metabacillus mangrovi]